MNSGYSAVRTGSLDKAVCAASLKGSTGSNGVRVFRNAPDLFQSSSHCNRIHFKIETVLLILNFSKLQVKIAPVDYKRF